MRTLLTRSTRDARSRWALDPDFSAVEFTVPHLGIGYLRGRFHDVALMFDFTAESPGEARLELAIGPQSIGSGTRAWVPLAADVFNAGGFGAIRFTGHTPEPIGPRRLALHGELAIRGAALAATLELVLRGEATDGEGVRRLGLGGSLVFSRRAFGIQWPEPQDTALGDEMRIAVDAELVRAEEPPSAA